MLTELSLIAVSLNCSSELCCREKVKYMLAKVANMGSAFTVQLSLPRRRLSYTYLLMSALFSENRQAHNVSHYCELVDQLFSVCDTDHSKKSGESV